MAKSLKELIVSYQANAQPVIEALNRIDQKIKTTSNQIQSFGTSMRNLGVELGAVFTVPFGMLAKKAISASADFESLKMQMEVLAGSAEKGSALFEKLLKLDVETPFELNQVASATNILMGFGQSSEQAYSNLRILGDVGAVVNSDFNRLAITFGQASAEGKLYTKDIRELINNNIPIIKILANELGVAENKIMDFAEQGKITFDVLVRALERATSKGGMFEGGMAKLAKTSKGVWSTFKGNVNIALATFGDELQKTFNLTEKLKQFGEWVGRLAENFKKLYPETKKNIFLFLGVLTILPPILIFIGIFTRLIGTLTLAFALLIKPIKIFVGLLPYLVAGLRSLSLANPLAAFLTATSLIIVYWKEIVELFKKAATLVGKFIPSFNEIEKKQSSIDYSPTDYKQIFQKTGSALNSGIGFLNNFLAERNLLPESFLKSGINNAPSTTTNRTTNNNLIVNIPASVSSVDAMNIKDAVKKALSEQNRQSYMEMGVQ